MAFFIHWCTIHFPVSASCSGVSEDFDATRNAPQSSWLSTVWIAARISALAVCADSSARRVQACSLMVCSGSVILDGLHGWIGSKRRVSESAQPQNDKIKRSGRDQTGRKQEHSDHGRLTECNPVRISPESQEDCGQRATGENKLNKKLGPAWRRLIKPSLT